MNYLLDTHALLWYLNGDPQLPTEIKDLVENVPDVSVSIGVFWEMAIKESIGKLYLPAPISVIMEDCERMGFAILPIKAAHLEKLKTLPRLHGDPFDRLYICQAQAENMTLITADSNVSQYEVQTLWA